MPNFAAIENKTVVNIIIADSKKIAEDTTGKTCVEFTEDNPAHIGLKYDGKKFEQLILPVEQSDHWAES